MEYIWRSMIETGRASLTIGFFSVSLFMGFVSSVDSDGVLGSFGGNTKNWDQILSLAFMGVG